MSPVCIRRYPLPAVFLFLLLSRLLSHLRLFIYEYVHKAVAYRSYHTTVLKLAQAFTELSRTG